MRRLPALLLASLALAQPAAAERPFDPFAAIGIDTAPGAAVPAGAQFRDEAGRAVRLGDYLGERPVILAPIYYRCPNICGATTASLFSALDRLPLRPGRDFTVVAVSIDPREGPADAADAEKAALLRYRRADAAAALHFLTGAPAEIDAVARAIGFRYAWDPGLRQYAHAAGIAVLTPAGKVARWLYGSAYEPTDLRLALVEAGEGRIGGIADRFLLLCYHYDPKTGRYDGLVGTLLQVGGGATAAGLAGFVLLMLRRERRPRRDETA